MISSNKILGENNMKQFDIKFTKENLEKHLNYNPNLITSLRLDLKGEIGDITIINDNIYMLINSYKLIYTELLTHFIDELWKLEGFSSKEEYLDEIIRIYGDKLYDSNIFLYIHILSKIEYRTKEYKLKNSVTGKTYTIKRHSSKILSKSSSDIKGLWSENHE